MLEKLGIYGRKIEVDDQYSGIENIASTYGFTGVEPNTVMMNWNRTTKSPDKYVQMTQKLIHLDYNLLYLDYDERTHFGDQNSLMELVNSVRPHRMRRQIPYCIRCGTIEIYIIQIIPTHACIHMHSAVLGSK